MKRGYWYRPLAAGYTSDISKAGRYSEAEARERVENVHGVTMHPLAECLDDVLDQIDETKQRLAVLEGMRSALSVSDTPGEDR